MGTPSTVIVSAGPSPIFWDSDDDNNSAGGSFLFTGGEYWLQSLRRSISVALRSEGGFSPGDAKQAEPTRIRTVVSQTKRSKSPLLSSTGDIPTPRVSRSIVTRVSVDTFNHGIIVFEVWLIFVCIIQEISIIKLIAKDLRTDVSIGRAPISQFSLHFSTHRDKPRYRVEATWVRTLHGVVVDV